MTDDPTRELELDDNPDPDIEDATPDLPDDVRNDEVVDDG